MEEAREILVEDGDGVTMKMIEFCGRTYPPFKDYQTILPMLKQFKARPDDIVIVTYPKSGTTWSRWLTNELIRGPLEGILRMPGFLEASKQDVLNAMESPRILYTHLTPDIISSDLFDKKCKIVYVVRNVKDALVSLYGHLRNVTIFGYTGSFSGLIKGEIQREGLKGSWFEHLRIWEKYFDDHPETPVLFLNYEDMKQDTLREVRKLRDFLHLEREDTFCEQVVQRCSFGNMQSRDHREPMIPSAIWRENKSVFFRKGEVGDWKNWLTVAQSERLDDIYKKEMQGSKFTLKYVL